MNFNPPHNKGRKGVSPESSAKMSSSAKARAARGILPNNAGKISWCRGLTKDTHPSLASSSAKQLGKSREGNYPGGERHWNWKGPEHITAYQAYKRSVYRLTQQLYRKHKATINPHNHPRGRCGTPGAFQLDHIISIFNGFTNNISAVKIAAIENLQMLPWSANLLKKHH